MLFLSGNYYLRNTQICVHQALDDQGHNIERNGLNCNFQT